MQAVNYSTVRENLKAYCDRAIDDSEVIIITRKDNKNAVLISLDEYNNIQENLKLLGNRNYLAKIDKSLKQLEKGNIVVKTTEDLAKHE